MARKRTKKKKRTISPEHLAKMQEGRKKAQLRKKRIARLNEHGLSDDVPMTNTERMLNSVRRK